MSIFTAMCEVAAGIVMICAGLGLGVLLLIWIVMLGDKLWKK